MRLPKPITYPSTRTLWHERHCTGGYMVRVLTALLFLCLFATLAVAQDSDRKQALKLVTDALTLLKKPSPGSSQQAIQKLEAALPLFRSAQEHRGELGCLMQLGKTYYQLGDARKAIDYYLQALETARGINEPKVEMSALSSLGAAYGSVGEGQKAIKMLEQSLEIARNHGYKDTEMATVLNNTGEAYREAGDYPKARAYFGEALTICRSAPACNEASTLSNIGIIESEQGNYQEALNDYEKALKKANAHFKPTVLNNIGEVYRKLGSAEKAREFANQALKGYRDVGDRNGEATELNNLGLLAEEGKRPREALTYFNQALAILQQEGDRSAEATTLDNIGIAYSDLGQLDQAQVYANQALDIYRAIGDLSGEATALGNIGAHYFAGGNTLRALEYYQQAIPILRAIGDRYTEAATLSNSMLALKDSNRPLAVFYGKQCINVLQQLRANIHALDRKLQKQFLASIEDNYRALADVLISEGRLPEAQQVLGLLKEEEFSGFARRDATTSSLLKRSDLSPAEKSALERYSGIVGDITRIATQFRDLKASGASTDDPRYQKLKGDLEAANRSFQVILREIGDEFKTEPDTRKLVVQELQENKGLQTDLAKWGSGAVSLNTVVSDDNYHVILTTPTIQLARAADPPIKRAELNNLVLQFREALQDPHSDPRPLGNKLYQILISPVAKDLEDAGAQTLVWSLDGTLRYLPMAALYDGKQYLAERYANVMVTLASRTRLGDTPSATWRGLGLGVSKGLVKEWGTFRPLPSVPAELRAIIRDENTNQSEGVLPGTVMLDGAFQAQSMQRALNDGHYTLVHIASHFVFKPAAADSFLLLGDGNRLMLDEIVEAPTPFFAGVDLLTLSACDTATGSAGDGKEVEGFAVIAQQQGASAVLGTLWAVADDSTRLLMQNFYLNRMTKPGITKAEALRQAQLRLLHSQAGGGPNAATTMGAQQQYAHPYFWAPFILIGNWR